MWGVDAEIAVDGLRVFALVAERHQYPDNMGDGRQIEAILREWQPALVLAARRPQPLFEERMAMRITEAELARDVRAAFARVERAGEVIIEQDDPRPVAVLSDASSQRMAHY